MAFNPVESSSYSGFKIFTRFTALNGISGDNLAQQKRLALEEMENYVLKANAREHVIYDTPLPLNYYFTMSVVDALMNTSIGGRDIYENIKPLQKTGSVYTIFEHATNRYLQDIEKFNHYASTRKGNASIIAIQKSLEIKKERAIRLFDRLDNNAKPVEYYYLENQANDVDRIKKPGGITLYFDRLRAS